MNARLGTGDIPIFLVHEKETRASLVNDNDQAKSGFGGMGELL